MRSGSALAREALRAWLVAECAWVEYRDGYDLTAVDCGEPRKVIGQMNRALKLAAMIQANAMESA